MTAPPPPAADFRLMPAEWEPHEATWLCWPHHEPDWPGKLEPVIWVYADIVRVLAEHERVEIVCHNDEIAVRAADVLTRNHARTDRCRFHVVPTDRGWLRDSAPTGVRTAEGGIAWIDWRFNAWAKYDNFADDDRVPVAVAKLTDLPRIEARRPDTGERLVLEGGAIDTDGRATLLTTEECLLSDVQARNPGLSRDGYEAAFREYLGITRTIWLGRGCAGDDTHGHIDDVARFVAPGTVVLAYEEDPADENQAASVDNLRRLEAARDADGRRLRVVRLPMPRPVMFEETRLPASYANFYIANGVVLVPTFNDVRDREALNILVDLFPGRRVIGIHGVDLVWGLGTLHCMTQQQPATAC